MLYYPRSEGNEAMQHVGVDIVEIWRIQVAMERWGGRFLERVYTPTELAQCRGRAHRLASRFAAKEAVMKALGTGARGVSWREIEVISLASGAPTVHLHGRARSRADLLGLTSLAVSLSDSRENAMAIAVGESPWKWSTRARCGTSSGAIEREAVRSTTSWKGPDGRWPRG